MQQSPNTLDQELTKLETKADDIISLFEQRQKECKNNGHKKIVWFKNNGTVYGPQGRQMQGYCQHCFTPFTRYPTAEENLETQRFEKDLRTPFDV